MLSNAIRSRVEDFLGKKILSTSSIAGGDINQARLIITTAGNYFIKINSKPIAIEMFETEAKGLNLLRKYNVISIPEVIY